MVALLYMRSVVDLNVVMWRMTVFILHMLKSYHLCVRSDDGFSVS